MIEVGAPSTQNPGGRSCLPKSSLTPPLHDPQEQLTPSPHHSTWRPPRLVRNPQYGVMRAVSSCQGAGAHSGSWRTVVYTTSVTPLSTILSFPTPNYTLGNLIQIRVISLILLVFRVLLFQARPSPRGPSGQQEVNAGGDDFAVQSGEAMDFTWWSKRFWVKIWYIN